GGSPGQQAALADAQGQVELNTGRYADAHGHFERALDIHALAGHSDLPELGVLRRTLADAAVQLGRLDAAQTHLDAAMVSLDRHFCDRHPETAAALHAAGALALRRGDPEAALRSFEQAQQGI